MNARRIALLLVVAIAAAGGTWFALRDRSSRDALFEIDPDTMRLVPDSVRIKVELLNASGERGLARRAMRYFRDRGFDVVSVGNATERADSSVILVRSGNAEWAEWAARAARPARIEMRPDTSRYLDLTILLGSSFRSLPQILYP